MLKQSYNDSKAGEVLRNEMSKLFWDTPERSMRIRILLAFVKEMGHEFESIVDGAIEEERSAEVVESALVAANHQIASAKKGTMRLTRNSKVMKTNKNDENDKDGKQDWCDESFGVRVNHSLGTTSSIVT